MTIAELSKNASKIYLEKGIRQFYGEDLMRLVELQGGRIEIDTATMQYYFRDISDSLQKQLDEYKHKKLNKL